MGLTFEQYNELLSKITDKGVFDYVSILLPSMITLATLFWSYKTFNKQAKLLKDEKLFSKDVEKIYEALDLLFNYFDASNLFFSLNEKEFNKALRGNALSVGEGLTQEASDAFYKSIRDFKRASFLMKALGKESISAELDQYHSNNILLRKDVLKTAADMQNQSAIRDLIEGTQDTHAYAARVAELDAEFNKCIKEIVKHKQYLKDKTEM